MTHPLARLMFIATMTIGATPALAQEPIAPPAARPTLTVMSFDTDRSGWIPPPHLGETLAELLTDQLVAAGRFRLVDRSWLTPADGRSRLPFDEFCDRAERAGVDYVIAGAVTRFSTEKRSSTGGGVLPLPFIGGLIRKHKTESIVGLTLRIIDVRSGEVIATATAESGASADTKSGGGLAVVGKVPVIGGKSSSASGVLDGLVDEAVQQAVTAAAEQIRAAVAIVATGREVVVSSEL